MEQCQGIYYSLPVLDVWGVLLSASLVVIKTACPSQEAPCDLWGHQVVPPADSWVSLVVSW